jgi:hypothetical protein
MSRPVNDHWHTYIHYPVGGHGETGAFGAEGESVDFGRVQPWNAEDAHRERSEEQEEERHGDGAHGVRVRAAGFGEAQGDGDYGPADSGHNVSGGIESSGGDRHDTYEQAAAEVIMTDRLPNRSMTKYAMKEKKR